MTLCVDHTNVPFQYFCHSFPYFHHHRPTDPTVKMAEEEEVVEPLHLDFEDREVYLAKIPVRVALVGSVVMVAVWWCAAARSSLTYERLTTVIGVHSCADGAWSRVEERARCC